MNTHSKIGKVKMMKRITFLGLTILLLLIVGLKGYSQSDSSYVEHDQNREQIRTPGIWDRIYFGGNVGFQLGTSMFIDLSPLVGYHVTDRFSTGLGITYRYVKFGTYQASTYGARVFARYLFTSHLFAHAEYENLNTPVYVRATNDYQKEWVPGIFVGGGFTQQIGQRSFFNLLLLYNLAYDQAKSPYSSPLVIRLGFFF